MDKLLMNVQLTNYRPRKDKSVGLSFVSQLEVNSEKIKELHDLIDTNGVLYYKPSGNLTAEEVKVLDETELEYEGKTKSQRLRNVLWVLHKETKDAREFNDFYSQKMESMIEHFKGQIPE